MEIPEFLACIKNGEIPPSAPYIHPDDYSSRRIATKAGMWAIVTLDWTRELADWIGNRHVLEVMAGKGWLAKALSQHGTNLVATDSMEWENMHSDQRYVFPVQKMGAREAVEFYREANLLLISWPPYDEHEIIKVCEAWGTARPIVYIGEGSGGCNAPDEFFAHFRKEPCEITIPQWPGIHDYLQIGYWKK